MPKPHSAPQVSSELGSPKAPRSSGYAEQYRRQRKKLEYKTYTIDDYRKLKKEMKPSLGTLGPDLESDAHKERVRYVTYVRVHLHYMKIGLLHTIDVMLLSQVK